MERSESISGIATALSEAQGEFPIIPKESSNPFFKSKYAELSTIVRTVQPVLRKHGLSVTQLTEDGESGITVRTMLMHKSGEYISGTLKMQPVKSDPQGIGSAITYARRYGLSAILGIATDDDDDGAAASGTTGQAKTQTKKDPPKQEPKAPAKKAPSLEGRKKDIWDGYVALCQGDTGAAKSAILEVVPGKSSKDWEGLDLDHLEEDLRERAIRFEASVRERASYGRSVREEHPEVDDFKGIGPDPEEGAAQQTRGGGILSLPLD